MMITPKRWCGFLSAANKRSKIISILLLSLFLFQTTQGQVSIPAFQTEFAQKNQSGPQYQLGDRIQLSVRIPPEVAQELGTVTLKNGDETKPLDQQGWYLDNNAQMIDGNLRFIVSPIKPGKLILPELLIMKDENHPVAKTTAIDVDVANIKADPAATPVMLDTIAISLPLKFVILFIFILALIALGCFLLYKKYWAKRIQVKATNEIKVPPTPDHVIALRELDLLYEQRPYSRENMKPVAFGVSQILKNFFSQRFKVDARESTTDEMLALLKGEALPEPEIKKIRALFQNLDTIKFTESAHHEHFQKADYLEFKSHAKTLVEAWALKGDAP